jgi:hypothetical protein
MGPVVLEPDKDLSHKFMGQVKSMLIIYPKPLKYIYFFNELFDFINRHSFKSPNGIRKTWSRCRPFSSKLTVAPEYKRIWGTYCGCLILKKMWTNRDSLGAFGGGGKGT